MPFMTLAARNLKMIKVLNREEFVALVKKKTQGKSYQKEDCWRDRLRKQVDSVTYVTCQISDGFHLSSS